jgi:hypothetical protein
LQIPEQQRCITYIFEWSFFSVNAAGPLPENVMSITRPEQQTMVDIGGSKINHCQLIDGHFAGTSKWRSGSCGGK